MTQIPNQLLEERDRGNVVFFCGAGVSFPAGMPNFHELAWDVLQQLNVPVDADSRKMFDRIAEGLGGQLDAVFNQLQNEYPGEDVDYEIARRLRTKAGIDLSAHELILRLSRVADGTQQIVTTNFDLLFEKAAGRKLKRFVPPALPDLASEQPLDGLVYLHGRMNSRLRRGEGRQGFVVSSADFGRAYLAHGWATRFVRELLDRYTVVLLGYSANDPPMQYLLQGLQSQPLGRRMPIYAFHSSSTSEIEQRWRDVAINPIPYRLDGDSHHRLWDTLSAWAARADDQIAWREKVVVNSP